MSGVGYDTNIYTEPATGRQWTRNYTNKAEVAQSMLGGAAIPLMFGLSFGLFGLLFCPILLIFGVLLVLVSPVVAICMPVLGVFHRSGACPWCRHITKAPSDATNASCQSCNGPIQVSPGVFMRMLDYRELDSESKPTPPPPWLVPNK